MRVVGKVRGHFVQTYAQYVQDALVDALGKIQWAENTSEDLYGTSSSDPASRSKWYTLQRHPIT